jgi:hypothetical protein
MAHAARILLYFFFAGIGLTLIASGLMWWFETSRRLGRALHASLGKTPDAVVFDLDGKKAAGLDFTAGDLAVLWETGGKGLVFSFDEIEGAELIVDERVVARAQKGEPRRVLNETHANAGRVILRLMFDDVEMPEFEISLFGEISQNPVHAKTAADAVRLGRKWLSHVDAVIKRLPQTQAQPESQAPYPAAEVASPPHHSPAANPAPRIQSAAPWESLPPWKSDESSEAADDEAYHDHPH